MKKLKVSYIYFHDVNFIPIHAFEIVNELANSGHEVHVFTSINRQSAAKNFYGKRITLHNLKTLNISFISEIFFMGILIPYLLIQTIRQRPDFFYSRHSAVSFVPALLAKFFKIPHIIEINDIVLDKLRFSRVSKLKRNWMLCYHYINFRLADLLLPVTGQIGHWLNYTYHPNPHKIVVSPNGVNTQRFSPKSVSESRKRYQIPSHANVVLSLGSLFPWAGIEILIDAAPQILRAIPDTFFVIGSGEEPYVSRHKDAVKKLELDDRFLFFGFIPWDEAAWFISMADICVAPFVFKEIRSGISSLRVLSYLACAKPVVGSDIPDLKCLLEANAIGLSFPMGDPQALAERIITLLSDKVIVKAMGARARKLAVDRYSWKVVAENIVTLSRQLIQPQG